MSCAAPYARPPHDDRMDGDTYLVLFEGMTSCLS
jgi:hypothetical protein